MTSPAPDSRHDDDARGDTPPPGTRERPQLGAAAPDDPLNARERPELGVLNTAEPDDPLNARERRQLGAHYTAERDILKILGPLVLDDMKARLAALAADRSPARDPQLRELLRDLRRLQFLDPACGAGNFLVVAYRELRRLETRALALLHESSPHASPRESARMNLDQLHGIELLAAPARRAAARLQQLDDECDRELAGALGDPLARAPATPQLHVGNALHLDWRALLPPDDHALVLGNPPFVGKHQRSPDQRADMRHVFGPTFKNTGDLDYAACWLVKAAEYCQHSRARCAFVLTSSLCQGEQVPLLWQLLFERYHLKIHFAHRTFRWSGDGRESAQVHVVIVGFGAHDRGDKRIHEYSHGREDPSSISVTNIGPYLHAGPDRYVRKSRVPLSPGAPAIRCGNKPSDGGHLLFTDAARAEHLRVEPAAQPLFRRFVGAEELLHGGVRWCLWIEHTDAALLRRCPRALAAVERVRQFRLRSTAAPTRAAAVRPQQLFYISQPATDYIAIPEISSERRRYIPIGYLPAATIASNKLYIIAAPSLFVFGLLSSAMHMAWVRVVAGRLKSDYQYSGTMVYNTFPWPEASEGARADVEAAARAVLAARAASPAGPLAALYDPASMPAPLSRAHADLDDLVDRCYRPTPFAGDHARFEHLFARYEQLTARTVLRKNAGSADLSRG